MVSGKEVRQARYHSSRDGHLRVTPIGYRVKGVLAELSSCLDLHRRSANVCGTLIVNVPSGRIYSANLTQETQVQSREIPGPAFP
jgi:hypothetical protein